MFRDVSLPHEIAFGASSGPEFATDVFASPGGWEERRGHWPQNRGRWEISFINKTGPEMDLLLAFFRCIAVGKAYSFRFKDFTDYQFLTAVGVGNGIGRSFQLTKVYQSGYATFVRILTKPIPASVRVWLNSIETFDFCVDGVTGLLWLPSPPAIGISVTASGEFDCMVRFDQDTLELTAVDPGPHGVGVLSIDNLALVEVVNEEPEFPMDPCAVVLDFSETEHYEWHDTYSIIPRYRETWEA